MQINPKEVESITTVGKLNDEDVKLLKTRGGLNILIGRKSKKGKKKDDVLAAGSHQGIALYQIEKQYGNDFQPSMFKSEHDIAETVTEKTDLLPKEVSEAGAEMYVIKKNNDLEFIVTKFGVTICKYEAEIKKNNLFVTDHKFRPEYAKFQKYDTSKSISKAIMEEVKNNGLDGVKYFKNV